MGERRRMKEDAVSVGRNLGKRNEVRMGRAIQLVSWCVLGAFTGREGKGREGTDREGKGSEGGRGGEWP